jgi:hypothetical protein
MSSQWFQVTRSTRLRTLALISLIAIGGCSNPGHRTSESASPTAPTGVVASTSDGSNGPTVIDRSGPGGGGGGGSNAAQDVTFPPRNEPFDFRLRLETQYQSVLRRSAVSSFVDIEGTIVWTQEYLRYRVNGCSHQDAIARVTSQILGSGVQPVCSDFTGTTVNFPPRDQPFAFRQELERIYRDVLRRGAVQTFVDTEGDIVWTQEYLRYRVNNCSHTEAVDRVLAQTLGAAVQPVCTPGSGGGGGGGGGTSPGGGGSVTSFVSAVSSGSSQGVQQSTPRPNAGGGPTISVASAGAFTPGGITNITLNASSPVTNVFVSANSTLGSTSLRPEAVTDTFYLITLPSPQTVIPLSVRLPSNVSGRFALEFGGSAAGGPVGNFAQLPVQIDTPATCTYALIPASASFGANGGAGTVSVSVQQGCGWTLSSSQGFVTLATSSGTGSLQVGFNVAANGGPARTARLTLTGTSGGGAIFDVSQAGTACTYSTSAANTNQPPQGGTLSVTITTGPTCGWSVASLSSFVTTVGATSGTGTGTATFSVAGNTSTSPRNGTIRVSFTATGGTQDIGFTQSGLDAPAPQARISGPSSCAVNTSCSFSGAGSTGQIDSYDWDFGDGTRGSGPMVSHTYPTNFVATTFSSRVATVTLTVRGPGGETTSSFSVTITRTY